jgi:hypothetical protein
VSNVSRYDRVLKPYGVKLLSPEQHPHKHRRAPTFAQRRGQAYERWVVGELSRTFGAAFIPGLWFSYWDSGHISAVQLDGVLIELSKGRITIIEVKHQHTGTAWSQLNFYRPVVEAALCPAASHAARRGWEFDETHPLWEITLVEICNWADFTAAPAEQIWDLAQARPGAFNVLQMRKS